MVEKKLRRMIPALLLCMVMLICACGDNTDRVVLHDAFRSELAASLDDMGRDYYNILCRGGIIYTASGDGAEICVQEIGGDGVVESSYDLPELTGGDEAYIQSFTLTSDGGAAFAYCVPAQDGTKLDYYISKREKSGGVSIYRLEGHSEPIEFFLADKNGNYYVASDDRIRIYTSGGEPMCVIDIDGEIEALADGRAAYKDGGLYYKARIIPETGELSEPSEVKLDGILRLLFDESGRCFADTSDILYAVEDEGGTRALINWNSSAIDHSLIGRLFIIDDDNAVYYRSNTIIGKNQFVRLTRIPDGEAVEKTILTLGMTRNYGILNQAVAEFNQTNGIYSVELRDYSPKKDDPDAYERFELDIAAGDIPDIIQISDKLDYLSLSRRGLFAELSGYIENDSTLAAEDFLDNIIDAFSQDGKLYMLPYTIEIRTAAAKSRLLEGYEGWTVDDFLRFAGDNGGALMTFNNRASDFDLLCTANAESIRGELGRRGGVLEKLLGYSKELPENYPITYMDAEEQAEYDADNYKLYRDERVLLWTQPLRTFNDYITLKGAFGDEAFSFVGYPTGEGGRSFLEPQLALALASKSRNADGAWEFMRSLLNAELYSYGQSSGFPTTGSGFGYYTETAGKFKFYFNPGGNAVASEYVYDAPGSREIALEDEDVGRILGLISDSAAYFKDRKMAAIITEEAGAYFGGHKTLEETLRLIGDRLGTYFEEQAQP